MWIVVIDSEEELTRYTTYSTSPSTSPWNPIVRIASTTCYQQNDDNSVIGTWSGFNARIPEKDSPIGKWNGNRYGMSRGPVVTPTLLLGSNSTGILLPHIVHVGDRKSVV